MLKTDLLAWQPPAWGLGKWTAMEEYVNFIPKETQDGAFYRSVLAIHREAREQYGQA
ncbi:hypothetical protein DAPPUDRAFT_334482 [Daphnia pulex]|uniref:PIK-related kinase FAT domain-containing protein n=1 Tax=Daphnia pulex TaxID=6669 RepID=E9HVM8_DAPPU|nr:hypothetical protein DAPPUDRAFT_334482 [Daphnia pulex]|eukprot:EFX64196.1 hypothetical protein DAPPUDRAFT_334482 [Daphnia pulex]